jgi:hypothetical protein
MCETLYQPDLLAEQRLEQLLHNASTWQDALRVEAVAGKLTAKAAGLLAEAANELELVRVLALRALGAQCAAALEPNTRGRSAAGGR